ncbi:unnamed protein product [Vicia faba]|uniref:Uncharacterized protein n=1 Tax=Vicia faba TaxID=3906 RepID=A0AAV1A870_VICFA|nr:unnamed protein product [Vicia faba]
MNNVQIRFGSMRYYHDKDPQGTNLRNPDNDKDVADIQYAMMSKPQIHKENENYVHEDTEVGIARANGGIINNHDHAKTLGEYVNERYFTSNGKKYRLISNYTTTQINRSVDFIGMMNEKNASLNGT